MANDFSEDTTLEELVMLSGQDDPAAMLALANTALSAGRWAEGEFYAIQSARTSGSPEPLWHVGLQRQQSSRNPFQDRISASWFLSAYLEGYLGAAIYVEAYFRVMDESDQIWSVARAQEILADLNNQG